MQPRDPNTCDLEDLVAVEQQLTKAKALIDEMLVALAESERQPYPRLDPQQRAAQRIEFRRRRAALDAAPSEKP